MAEKIDSFDRIIGHKNLIIYLKKWIETNSVPDVLLFHGAPGLGKSTIAKLMAVELTTSDADKQSVIQTVIRDNRSTGSIKLFNMSVIEDKEEEIQKVSSELNMNFVNTRHKVLILDEAHEMSKQAQNSILTELEHLPEGLHVFICTTEINALRPAFLSRCRDIQLHPLSDNEAKQLFLREVRERNLQFEMSMELASASVCSWADNQPRKIINLLDNFGTNKVIKSRELEIFVNTINASAVIELVKYLYGSLTLGIDYIQSIRLDETFVMMLIEVTKVALGMDSNKLSRADNNFIQSFMSDKDENKLLQFVVEVSGLSTLYKRRVISAFIRAHVSYKPNELPKSINTSREADLQTVAENVETVSIAMDNITDVKPVESLDSLFEQSNAIE